MKKEVVFVFMFMLFLVSCSSIYASKDTQVKSAYACLESRINQTGCSSLNFEEKVFSVLATGKCTSELIAENLSNQCWPKSGCRIKSTAQALLALNEEVDTTRAENWLLSQNKVPDNVEWFLEIESSEATSCKITYSGNAYIISIGADKKISSNAGAYLKLAQSNYWLNISQSIYNKDISIQCNKPFITTLLFRKIGSSTIHVSEEVHGAGMNGITSERVNSLCFTQGGACNYEGSLWATFVLYYLGYEEDVQDFMPYLITMMDDPSNQIYIPESFLYYLTGKFRTELLLKQKPGFYWEESGNRYYDTALALLPFGSSDSSTERENSKSWLLGIQQKSGCWNNGNIKDTAFILYSIWPKSSSIIPSGECSFYYDCYEVSCKKASCEYETCFYDWLDCVDNDYCCSPGCNVLTDNDCIDESECTSDSQCEDYNSESNPYCLDNDVYKEVSTWTCENEECVENVDEERVERCSNSEYCEDAECIPDDGGDYDECQRDSECGSGKCIGGECIPPECETALDCYEVSCKERSCEGGVCFYDWLDCVDNDYCCSPGCTYAKDNDCEEIQCTSDSECKKYDFISDKDCDYYNNRVYIDMYNYTCESEVCVEEVTEKVVKTCDNTEECYSGECYSSGCTDDSECYFGECINEGCVPYECEEDYECAGAECIGGECIPYGCEEEDDCLTEGQICVGGSCVPGEPLDCLDEEYFCTSRINCENNEGNPLEGFYCSGALFVCCDTATPLNTCTYEGGEICESGEECIYGTIIKVSDAMLGEECCVEGTCQEASEEIYCETKNGVCKESCENNEEEKFYTCYSGEMCCVAKEKDGGGKWILIIFLLILISLAVLGIVFRDKLRTQWLKLKDKFGGKKEKKKFEMPLTSHPSPQGRILPRRILPSSQQQSRFPVRRPISSQYPPANRTSQINKKPEEKPKSDLDDVLKKLREMGK